MIKILYLCREYGWKIDYVLDLPFKAIEPIQKNTARLESINRVELLRIALASGSDKKYYTKLMEFYAGNSASAIAKKPVKSVNTSEAFNILRGRI